MPGGAIVPERPLIEIIFRVEIKELITNDKWKLNFQLFPQNKSHFLIKFCEVDRRKSNICWPSGPGALNHQQFKGGNHKNLKI